AGTAEEQAKNFQWGLRKSTLNHLMCIPFTDVAQVTNASRNYEILHERDDDGAERPDKSQKSRDRHQPTTQQSSHRNHGHNNDRHGSDRRCGGDDHHSNNNYSGNNNRSSGNGHDQRNRGQQSNRPVDSGIQQSRGPSEGYSYPVCTTCGHRHPGECRRAAGTYFNTEFMQHFLRLDGFLGAAAGTEEEQRFLRLAGFLGAAAGTEEEQAKNFQWSLRRLNFKSVQSSSTHEHDPNITA
nr:hypothetical protein [Tanacetum cinerariifolium]